MDDDDTKYKEKASTRMIENHHSERKDSKRILKNTEPKGEEKNHFSIRQTKRRLDLTNDSKEPQQEIKRHKNKKRRRPEEPTKRSPRSVVEKKEPTLRGNRLDNDKNSRKAGAGDDSLPGIDVTVDPRTPIHDEKKRNEPMRRKKKEKNQLYENGSDGRWLRTFSRARSDD